MTPAFTSILVPPDGGEARRFLGTLATIKIDGVRIEQFVRALSAPTQERRLPDDADYPDTETIEAVFAKHEVTILGPSPTREDLRVVSGSRPPYR